MNSVATPPCKMKSPAAGRRRCRRRRDDAVFRPKQRRRPRDVVFAAALPDLNWRAVRMRPSPGSKRSMISPSEIRSYCIVIVSKLDWHKVFLILAKKHQRIQILLIPTQARFEMCFLCASRPTWRNFAVQCLLNFGFEIGKVWFFGDIVSHLFGFSLSVIYNQKRDKGSRLMIKFFSAYSCNLFPNLGSLASCISRRYDSRFSAKEVSPWM